MAGNQVLDWYDLDCEIKTAGVKNVSYYHPFLKFVVLSMVI